MFSVLIKKGQERIVELVGEEPSLIIIPVVKDYFTWCLQNSLELQIVLMGFDGQVDTHHPSHIMFSL